jgi:hypothetical protein
MTLDQLLLRMDRPLPLILTFAAVAACAGKPAESAPAPSEHSLAGLAAQHVAVLPTYIARVVPELKWSIGRPTELARTLDADIASAMDERGLKRGWVFPNQLSESYRKNSTYAADPYTFAEEPLRAGTLLVDGRLPEPLASQVRTLVALQQDVRLVLAPVELRIEPAGKGGRGVLRLVLLDARASRIVWVGDITSDTVESFSPAIPASIASKLAGVVAPR